MKPSYCLPCLDLWTSSTSLSAVGLLLYASTSFCLWMERSNKQSHTMPLIFLLVLSLRSIWYNAFIYSKSKSVLICWLYFSNHRSFYIFRFFFHYRFTIIRQIILIFLICFSCTEIVHLSLRQGQPKMVAFIFPLWAVIIIYQIN